MQVTILPRTTSGKWSVGLTIAAIVIFIMWQIGLAVWHTHAYVPSVPPGSPIPPGPIQIINWNLVIVPEVILCIAVVGTGLFSILKSKERSILVFVVTPADFLALLLLLGRLLFPYWI